MRIFSEKENFLKLKQASYNISSNEFAAIMDTFLNMQKLYTTKLNTPQEEVKSIAANLGLLKEKIQKLEQTRQNRKDAYDKYCEECSKSKEIRDNQIKILKEQVTYENSQRETSIENAQEQGLSDEQQLEKNHDDMMKKLEKEFSEYESRYNNLYKENRAKENDLREKYKKVHMTYKQNMLDYDTELKN